MVVVRSTKNDAYWTKWVASERKRSGLYQGSMTMFWEQRKCIVCGSEFFAGAENQKCCSMWCVNKAPFYECPPKPVFSNCKYCGKEFSPKTQSHLYCSKECLNEYHAKRQSRGSYIIFERDKFSCFYCGKTSYKDGSVFHVDHVIPASKGGGDIAENLVTACTECNLEKSASEIFKDTLIDMQREIRKRNKNAGIENLLNIKSRTNEDG